MRDSDAEPLGFLLKEIDSTSGILADEAIPREGRRLHLENVVARRVHGSYIGWTRRVATIGRGQGSSGLGIRRR